jgi:hypothetical protein
MIMPAVEKRDGLSLRSKTETTIEKIGVVLTRTVAFRIVVSFTADTNSVKCKPRNTLRTKRPIMFFLTRLKLKGLLNSTNTATRATQAIIKRQKTIDNVSTFGINLMKIAAVPNRTPAIMPSVRASFLVLTDTHDAIFNGFPIFNMPPVKINRFRDSRGK